VVIPLKRQATLQLARKGASRMGFDALARNTLLRALQMRYGHSTRRASRLRTSASETRLMRNVETGSNGVPIVAKVRSMIEKRCAFLTMENTDGWAIDFDLSFEPMQAPGWSIDEIAWRSVNVDWEKYQAVYICTPWD
jgi:hypothetical protein